MKKRSQACARATSAGCSPLRPSMTRIKQIRVDCRGHRRLPLRPIAARPGLGGGRVTGYFDPANSAQPVGKRRIEPAALEPGGDQAWVAGQSLLERFDQTRLTRPASPDDGRDERLVATRCQWLRARPSGGSSGGIDRPRWRAGRSSARSGARPGDSHRPGRTSAAHFAACSSRPA